MLGLGLLLWFILLLAFGFAQLHGRSLQYELVLPRHVEATRPFGYRVRLFNTSRLVDVWSLEVEVRKERACLSKKAVHWLPARGESALDLEGVIEHRGNQGNWTLTIRSTAPFGLVQSRYRNTVPVEFVVRPLPIWNWQPGQPGQLGICHGDRSWAEGWTSEGEPRGLRQWQTGEKPRSIIWPASLRSLAQGATLLVRDVDPPGNGLAEYTVLFHSYGGGGSLIRPWSFEEAIGHVAGVMKYLLANGLRVSLLADFNEWEKWECRDMQDFGNCHDMLALVERSACTEIHEVREAMDSIPETHGVIVLSDFPSEVWKEPVGLIEDRIWTRSEKKVNRLRKAVSR